MKAVRVTKESVELVDIEIPQLGPDEVLIKNVAVAANPKDFKMSAWGVFEGIEGNDVAGYIETVGADVKDFSKGDRVAGYSIVGKHDKYGAYAEYTVVPAHTTFKIANHISFEDAATVPLASMTAMLALFHSLGLPTPPEDGSSTVSKANQTAVVINGASSSVGAFGVQLAKRAGFYVVAIAGVSSDVAQELGADKIVDYTKEKDLVKTIQDASTRPAKHILDAVSTDNTAQMLGRLLAASGGGKLTTLLPVNDPDRSPDVNFVLTQVPSSHGENRDFATKWYKILAGWLNDGSLKPNRVEVLPKGLASVEDGLERLKQNKVSGVKLVYRIADTPGL